jgi:hypothetical protein
LRLSRGDIKMKSLTEMNLLPGDCLFTFEKSWLSKVILFFTSMQTGSAWCSHVACVIDSEHCIEALNKIKITKLSRFDNDRVVKKVYRIPLTDDQRKQFKEGAYTLAGDAYGYGKLFLFALDATATRIKQLFGMKRPCFFFTQHLGIFNIPVCSELYAYMLSKFCKRGLYDSDGFLIGWRIVSPDYLEDLLKLPVNKAVEICLDT